LIPNAELARKADIPPRRLSINVVAGFQGVRASSISAATVAMLGFVAPMGFSLPMLLAVAIPSTFLAVNAVALRTAWPDRSM
jgi:anaerobic C4-dicarboxylate transporter DcuB